ncbi:hypothetical protein [Cryptosporangium phraense]|uniref:(2Fe-2S) ferredoxin domain-containing protein n=1 Tax=Cryptosporangium phraense TaxID=2593070 RepID=A0A545AX29_9ACTN|nr:hypothetical protein [Cryptosporangium phraense]TQS45884.1 hypothetical protein FL583_05105 [Cryptosporangium phraense]
MSCSVTVCRDCCCGSPAKHPDVDHDAHLTALRAATRVRVSECIDLCARSNVVVVHPSPPARRNGARVVYLGEILDSERVDAVVGWLDAGGPGVAAVPDILAPLVFSKVSCGC